MNQTLSTRKPVIGIVANSSDNGCELAWGYYMSVVKAGGVPLVIPSYMEEETLCQTLDRIDALMLTGGGDVNPLAFGEEPLPGLHSVDPLRDEAELLLVREAYHRQIPMLGICRGMQVIALALGGSVYQDLDSQYTAAPLIKHTQQMPRWAASHSVSVEKGSVLDAIFPEREGRFAVNSFHHQAVNEPGVRLRVSARAADGVVEAIESAEFKSILGVQWHPECFITDGDMSMMPIFEWFVGQASSFMEAKRIHAGMLSLDSHCDTPMFFAEGYTPDMFARRTDKVLMDLPKMKDGRLDAVVMAAYLSQGERDDASLAAATAKADSLITGIENMVSANSAQVGLAYTPDDLSRLKGQGKKAVMIGIENGYAIGKDLSLLEHFRKRGVVYMTLCHNGGNDICDSAKGNAEHGGLSAFGRDVVREMNRLGMMVDLSHAAESTFYDTLQVSERPVVCTHSCCRALCDHPRNLTDDQMLALKAKGGVMQVTLYHGFLREDGEATVLDFVRHILHAVDVMGIDHVGIGSDFDGDGGVCGAASASDVINITRRLMENGFDECQLRKLWGANFLRVMGQVQG